jgi:hypothetical protein
MTDAAIFATMAGMPGSASDARRYLCSHLVTLRAGGQSRVVNLEEICRTGAALECDEPVPSGIPAEMKTETALFHGSITAVEEHELGWRIELEFSLLTPWSLDCFRPDHLVDLSTLQR